MNTPVLEVGLALFQVPTLTIWPASASSDERKEIAAQIHGEILKGWEEYRRSRQD